MYKWIVLLCLASLAAAQVQPPFRVGSRLVTVDVVVRNEKGPVKGLTKDDFTITDKGKTRNIAVFDVSGGGDTGATPQALPANVVSNRANAGGEESRTATALLFDRLNIPAPLDQATVRTKVLAFLASLKSTDRIGFYSLGTTLSRVQDFNENADPMVQAAKRLISPGQPPASDARSQEADARLKDALTPIQQRDIRVRTTTTTQALRTIARHLAGIPGHKNLIWVLSDFPLTFGEAADRRTNYTDEVATAVNIMNEANVTVHPMDPRGLTTSSAASSGAEPTTTREAVLMPGANASFGSAANLGLSGTETMDAIAKATGGTSYYGMNDIGVPVRKVLDESAVSYTLGFYVEEKALDGKLHDLNVKLAKKPETSGASARHRKTYAALNAQAARQERPSLAELVMDPLDATAVSIMATTAPSPSKPETHSVQVKVNVAELEFEHRDDKWVAAFDLGMAIETPDRKVSNVLTVPTKLNLSDEELKQGLASGLVIDSAVPSPAQPGQLRVVIQDKTSGAAGSVRIPIAR